MIEGVVLAAGASTRAGRFKMELPLGDKTLIECSIEGMYNVCSRVIVVGGFRVERVRKLLAGYSKVEVVENTNWQSGMFSSVQCGVTLVQSERFFLLPADVAFVPERVFRLLLASRGRVLIPTCQGRKGHPVLVDSTLKSEILEEPASSNLRKVLFKAGPEMLDVDDHRILFDVDSEEDCKKAVKHGVVALTGIEPVFEP